MPPRVRRKRRPPTKVTTAPTIPAVIIEGLPVGGNGFCVGLIIRPPFVWVCVIEGINVMDGITLIVGIEVTVGEGILVGVNDTVGVGIPETTGGLICCPAAYTTKDCSMVFKIPEASLA